MDGIQLKYVNVASAIVKTNFQRLMLLPERFNIRIMNSEKDMTLRKKESTNLGIQLSIRHTYCIDNIDLHHLRPPFTPILLFLWQEINILPWFEKILTSMHNYGDLGSNHKKAGFQKKLGKFLLTKIERKQSFGV